MKKTFTLLVFLLSVHVAFAQFTGGTVKLVDDMINNPGSKKMGKAAGNKVDCSGDTLEYARFKATSLTALNVSYGYRVGQFFEAPGEVTISGFDFYAWVNAGQVKTDVDVYCHIYEVGADSLPTGSPVRSDTINIDTSFGAGALSVLRKSATFKPYTTTRPFIIAVSSDDTVRASVGINSYPDGDGLGENVACGTVGGRWYRCLNLNIGGTTLDCDILLEPYVSYKVNNDFTFEDCYNYKDTVFFKNQSSPFYFSRMYNRYSFFGYDWICHRWDKGTGGFSVNEVEGYTKFATPRNREVRMVSTLYHYRGGGRCVDTTIKTLSYQPTELSFTGDVNICSGNMSNVVSVTDAETFWYRNVNDTAAFHVGPDYQSTTTLEENDTLYARGINNACKTSIKRKIVVVTQTPSSPTIKNDSVCLNSMANLVAKSDAGQTRWYVDSTTLIAMSAGDVLQVGPLNKDTFFFAKSINGACTHTGRVRVTAYVDSSFAPSEPVVNNDTTICLLHGDINLSVSGSNTLRWYDVAAGGTPVKTGSSYTFTPKSRGMHYMYVDAYDGNCASSRLPIEIEVNHFPSLAGLTNDTACVGETIVFDLQNSDGSINWFDGNIGGSKVYNGKFRIFDNVAKDETFYLEPYEGVCKDTVRHKWSYQAIPFANILSSTLDEQACNGTVPNLSITTDVGEVMWYDSTGDNVIHVGSDFVTPPFTQNRTYWYQVDNKGCKTIKKKQEITWRVMPDANFDYQVTWRDVVFASRLINQGDYIWEFDDGTDTSMGTDVTHHYYEDGTYNVSLIVASPFNCNDTVTKAVEINSVGVKDVEYQLVTVYPNPSADAIHIQTKGGFKPTQVECWNANGQLVYNRKFGVGQSHIVIDKNEAHLPAGVYMIKCSNSTTTVLTKITRTH